MDGRSVQPLIRGLRAAGTSARPAARTALANGAGPRILKGMPQDLPDLAAQRIKTALGTLEVDLPRAAILRADPGVVEGAAWYWSPQRDAVLTVSTGRADLRTPGALLDLERSLDGVAVEVLREEPGDAPGERHLIFRSTAASPSVPSDGGDRSPDPAMHRPAQFARFRFWTRSDSAVRLGYRLDERTGAAWRAPLDRVLDCARWR